MVGVVLAPRLESDEWVAKVHVALEGLAVHVVGVRNCNSCHLWFTFLTM
jgi:hypothetical protein